MDMLLKEFYLEIFSGYFSLYQTKQNKKPFKNTVTIILFYSVRQKKSRIKIKYFICF